MRIRIIPSDHQGESRKVCELFMFLLRFGRPAHRIGGLCAVCLYTITREEGQVHHNSRTKCDKLISYFLVAYVGECKTFIV